MKNQVLFLLVLVILATFVSASDLQKRTCGSSKRDSVLGKRNPPKKCPCQLAFADFDNVFTGYVVFAQDECGDTTVTGSFCKGLTQSNYTFDIVDDCGNVIEPLGDLGIKYTGDGGTKPFRQKFNFDLSCSKSGILNVPSAYYKKRNCHSKSYKRQTPGSGDTYMKSSGDPSAAAPLYT